MKIRIASRKSALAMWQSEHIKKRLEAAGHECEIIKMSTKGDVILDTPLAKIGGKGLFTKELENALLEGRADIAVHSLKDVPTRFEAGLELACVCSRENTDDCLLSMNYTSLEGLRLGARVGTTSLRRRMQILARRPDLKVISLRGNVNSRISKLQNGVFDAIILAQAGITRLGLEKLVNHISPLGTVPAMGQGALGIEIASANRAVKEAIAFLNDEKSVIETSIERAFVDTLNGGCQAPIGISAVLSGDKVRVKAILGFVDGSEILSAEREFCAKLGSEAGVILAREFISRGAKELLERSEQMSNAMEF